MSTIIPTLQQDYQKILDAMASFENVNPDYNNPGAVSYGQFAINHGATGSTANGIAIFPDYTTGSEAAKTLINGYAAKGSTVQDLINKWAPATGRGNSRESTDNYIKHVSGILGVKPDTPLTNISGGNPSVNSGSTVSGSDSSGSGFAGNVSRWVSIALGLILIAGGLLLFKPTQEVIKEVVKTGKDAGEAVAIA